MKARQFIDTAVLEARAGRGGNGSASFRREKFVPHGGPDGGDGGRGGHVYLVGDEDVDSLVGIFYEPRRIAEDGGAGKGRGMHGKNGADLVIPVPLGTLVEDADTGEVLGEIVGHGETLEVAHGGRGGWGNVHWKRPDHQAPTEHTLGTEGEVRNLRLDLRLLADAGLVGFPSAGKSSLLTQISRARPKVAAYHFTTLKPIMGTVVNAEKFTSFRVADIPGIIADAHLGAGLGFDFLRHIERSRVLVFVIDMGGEEGRDPVEDYRTLRHELAMRDASLLEREQVVVATKMDLEKAPEHLVEFVRETGIHPIETSVVLGVGFDKLVAQLTRILKPVPRTTGRAYGTVTSKGGVTLLGAAAEQKGSKHGKKPQRKRDTRDRRHEKTGREVRPGYTPPREIEGRGENPEAPDVIPEASQKLATFLKF